MSESDEFVYVPENLVREALDAVAAGAVFHHRLVSADDPRFVVSGGATADELALRELEKRGLIARGPAPPEVRAPSGAIRMALGIPVGLTPAGEELLQQLRDGRR